MRARIIALAAAALATSSWQETHAHHSFASYDMNRTVTVHATIKAFRWSAPHSNVVLMVSLPNGEAQELNLITGFPEIFARQGIPPKSVHIGDKVEASYHPNINGSAGGALASLTLPDGRTFKDSVSFGASPAASSEPAPPATPPPPR
jgi:hypothetical protein